MEIIKILPHHASGYFEAYFLKREPGQNRGWYDDEKFKSAGEELIRKVISHPSQLVQIVSSYDSFCNMCPKNSKGKNYVQPSNACTTYETEDFGNEQDTARMLGIDGLIGKEPITAEQFLRQMKPAYDRIFTEKPEPNSIKKSMADYFRVTAVELMLLQ